VKAPASNIDAAKTQEEKAFEFFREYKELGIAVGVVMAVGVYLGTTRSMIQTLRDEIAITKEQLDGKINFTKAELKLAIAKSDNGILKHLHKMAAYSKRSEMVFVQEGKQLASSAAPVLENAEKAAQKSSTHSGQLQREEVVTAAEGSRSGGEQQHQGASMPQML
jgi:hypothetical protein